MKVGMLVKTSDWRSIMLFPDEELAIENMFSALGGQNTATALTMRYRRPVEYLTEDIPLLVLNIGEDPRLIEVLAGDKKGWMIRRPTMIFRRVK